VGSFGNLKSFNVIAWYTLEIPYSFGPTKYNGLPGLILELKNRQAKIYASKILLNKKKTKEIKKPKKGIEITQRKYDSIKMGLATDFRKRHHRN
ncbi:MAG: GLPGLI family protein, partial [Polaribacter sp.]